MIAKSSGTQWEGFYAGINLGVSWNTTCDTWKASSSLIQNPAILNALNKRNCPNGGTFVGGAQFGYNSQYPQWVWGHVLDEARAPIPTPIWRTPASEPVTANGYGALVAAHSRALNYCVA